MLPPIVFHGDGERSACLQEVLISKSLHVSSRVSGVACVEKDDVNLQHATLPSRFHFTYNFIAVILSQLVPWFCVLASSTSRVSPVAALPIAVVASIKLQPSSWCYVSSIFLLFLPQSRMPRRIAAHVSTRLTPELD